MSVKLHPHAQARLVESGATTEEVVATVEGGETYPAKFGRTAFRRNFAYDSEWRGKFYATKQVEVIAVREKRNWLAVTVLVKFY